MTAGWHGLVVNPGFGRARGVTRRPDTELAGAAGRTIVQRLCFPGAGDERLVLVGVVFVADVLIRGRRRVVRAKTAAAVEVGVARDRGFGCRRRSGVGRGFRRVAHRPTIVDKRVSVLAWDSRSTGGAVAG